MMNIPFSCPLSLFLLAAGCAISDPIEATDDPAATAVLALSSELAPSPEGDQTSASCPPIATACRLPSWVTLASNSPGTLSYEAFCANTCTMSWFVPWNGSSGSVAWPVGAGTVGAGTGFVYTLSCALVVNGCAHGANSASVVVN